MNQEALRRSCGVRLRATRCVACRLSGALGASCKIAILPMLLFFVNGNSEIFFGQWKSEFYVGRGAGHPPNRSEPSIKIVVREPKASGRLRKKKSPMASRKAAGAKGKRK